VSVPLAVPRTALEMRKRGHNAEQIDKVVFQNPLKFLGQTPKFKIG
jgi:predicted metal-dependent TIM-barrel fold hydrolase